MVRLILMLFAFIVIGCSKDDLNLRTGNQCKECMYFIDYKGIQAWASIEDIRNEVYGGVYAGDLCTYLDTVQRLRVDVFMIEKTCK